MLFHPKLIPWGSYAWIRVVWQGILVPGSWLDGGTAANQSDARLRDICLWADTSFGTAFSCWSRPLNLWIIQIVQNCDYSVLLYINVCVCVQVACDSKLYLYFVYSSKAGTHTQIINASGINIDNISFSHPNFLLLPRPCITKHHCVTCLFANDNQYLPNHHRQHVIFTSKLSSFFPSTSVSPGNCSSPGN